MCLWTHPSTIWPTLCADDIQVPSGTVSPRIVGAYVYHIAVVMTVVKEGSRVTATVFVEVKDHGETFILVLSEGAVSRFGILPDSRSWYVAAR